MVGLLVAIYRTPLWDRLEKAGRLRNIALSPTSMLEGTSTDNTGLSTNFLPLGMSYSELIEGYAKLVERLFEEDAIYERLCNKMKHLRNPLPTTYLTVWEQIYLVIAFLRYGILTGGIKRWWNFLRSLRQARWKWGRLVAIFEIWTNSLTFKDFVAEGFAPEKVARSLSESGS